MKISLVILTSVALAHAATVDVFPRAFPNAPDGYTPANTTCPAVKPNVRSASRLSRNETKWLQKRRKETVDPMKEFLGRLDLGPFDAVSYIDKTAKNVTDLPNIGFAASGGGYRAMLNGAGVIKAFDNRTANATSKGQLGGLLQASTYVAGLSGGGWLVGSIFVNNFTTISDLQKDKRVWDLQTSILEGPSSKYFQFLSSVNYWENIDKSVKGKKNAGFDVTLTDYWGRALSYQLINSSKDDGGPSYTWSSIALSDNFKDGEIPMPLLVADGRKPGELLVGSNSTVYEFNPWEFGSWDPTIAGFAPLEYLGSKFDNGKLNDTCVRGFDNAGFVMGTSSSLFNQLLPRLNSTSMPDILKKALEDILKDLSKDDEDIAAYAPNPFYNYRNSTATYATTNELDLVDGGEDGQNIPLHPLIQPERHVDVIFAVDSSADTENSWPNGTSLVQTYERSLNKTGIANGTVFPSVPDVNTFVNLGLNNRPTFFGCNGSNFTGPTPLVVYLPNAPYTAESNTSTFQLSYEDSERDNLITNGLNVATMGNSSLDAQWPSCVGCAILQRSTARTGTPLPDICKSCFAKYCWNGTVDSHPPKPYQPSMKLGSAGSGNSASTSSGAAAGAASTGSELVSSATAYAGAATSILGG
ncbi:lysophospholipase family protein [Aspergillus candidus]|uniref:Lysophospholipase n=1 Tax=Aspergillus candidus TaxID=41067 RepID=A0A2I2F3L0_ASPCN|nr:lysophospholipase [Aspergillus candidus]PLB35232.1 lysophospholipase [Aspergillus candidus]